MRKRKFLNVTSLCILATGSILTPLSAGAATLETQREEVQNVESNLSKEQKSVEQRTKKC